MQCVANKKIAQLVRFCLFFIKNVNFSLCVYVRDLQTIWSFLWPTCTEHTPHDPQQNNLEREKCSKSKRSLIGFGNAIMKMSYFWQSEVFLCSPVYFLLSLYSLCSCCLGLVCVLFACFIYFKFFVLSFPALL